VVEDHAADRFTKIPASALDHRRFWNAMHAVSVEQLEEISRRIAVRMVNLFGLDCSSVALDMTNFATFIDTANDKAPIAARGKAKQKHADLRLVGRGLVATRDGGIPLTWHAYPGDRPDVIQFAAMIDQLRERRAAVCAGAGQHPADMTVVFDAGQNSEANFAHLAGTGLHYVGSVPASDWPDLTALPAGARGVVDEHRFGALTTFDTRRLVYGLRDGAAPPLTRRHRPKDRQLRERALTVAAHTVMHHPSGTPNLWSKVSPLSTAMHCE
jgi:hypothetical protein